MADRRPFAREPVETSQQACERPESTREIVGDDRQTERREPRGGAVGADQLFASLRRDPFNRVCDQGSSGQRQQGLVLAAKPPPLAASKKQDDWCQNFTQSAEKTPRSASELTPRSAKSPPTCRPTDGVSQ